MSDFSRKKYTQSNYRGSKKAYSKEAKILDTTIEPLKLKASHKDVMKNKVMEEVSNLLSKLIPEEVIESILQGRCLKTIFKKLGL